MAQTIIYLDYAAATPLDERVLAAMRPYLAADFYNPSAGYRAARAVRAALEAARSKAAHWLGARSSEIVFTAGGTEANNLAIHGVMRRFPEANVAVSALEHESVLAPAGTYDCREVAVAPDGRIELEDLRTKIDARTVLVSVMYANNEIGTVQPLREIGQLVTEIRQQRAAAGNTLPLYLHTDACQAANYLDLHVARLGVDLMTLNGGKIYGPKQSGGLFVKAGVELEPLISGGGQERGLRSGTENVAASVGFAEALDIAQATRRDETARLLKLQRQFMEGLQRQIPGAIINGSLKYRLPNNVHVTIPGSDNERLLIELDEAGIMAAAGSACSAANEELSHVLHALGLDDAAARASLRFTMGRDTTAAKIDRVVKALSRLA
ncbi:MAG TPA: cysteine desulfurase family protein [Candidatus Saccharimonadales bacterium]|nr:cysteine desulfurase family protein [Candidatus Saccharimonadales bacterium]